MVIQWYGGACVYIQTKFGEQDVSVVFNPLSEQVMLKPPRLYADIIVAGDPTHQAVDVSSVHGTALTEEPFLIGGAGEYEAKGVFLTGIEGELSDGNGRTILYRCDIERVVIGYLGFLANNQCADKQIEALGSIDILFVPIGGGSGLQVSEAVSIINQIEPRVVIPINYAIPDYIEKLNSLDAFVREFGVPALDPEKKFKINKKDLPSDDMRLVILEAV